MSRDKCNICDYCVYYHLGEAKMIELFEKRPEGAEKYCKLLGWVKDIKDNCDYLKEGGV